MEQLKAEDPRHIGAYRLLGRLGEGGMGRVFLARSERGRTVAVKLVQEQLAQQTEFRDRFRQEVQASLQVGGEWTAPVLDADTEAATPWVATGYIAGPSLQRVVATDYGPLPERSVVLLTAGLVQALRAIHAAGLIHRDMKPSNVLVTIDRPRVIDFGISRALEAANNEGLTRTGSLMGSPAFMAPEQVLGKQLSTATDVFCLGGVLAYAASGQQPFGSGDVEPTAVLFRIAYEEPELSGVPENLHPLISACLAKDPSQRPTLDQLLMAVGGADWAGGADAYGEPWLPGAVIAKLGQHAVELLDTENPDTGGFPVMQRGATDGWSAPPPQQAPPAQGYGYPQPGSTPGYGYPQPDSGPGYGGPQQTMGQGSLGTQGYGYPQSGYGYPGPTAGYAQQPAHAPPPPPAQPPGSPGPPRRSKSKGLLFALVLVLAFGGSFAGYQLLRPSDPATGDGKPKTVPKQFVGTWKSPDQVLKITQGDVGDRIATIEVTGANFTCTFAAKLAKKGTPLKLGPSHVVHKSPASAPCQPGQPSTVRMSGDSSLSRQLNNGKPAHVFQREG